LLQVAWPGEPSRRRMPKRSSPTTRQRFGAHLSIAGGLHKAIEAAEALRCDCLQVFVKNQRQWTAPALDPNDVRRWTAARRQADVEPVVAHATYLVNLASPERDKRGRSIRTLVDEVRRCAALKIGDLIVHPGWHMGAGLERGIARVAKSLDEVCRRTANSRVRILLETMAGQGSDVAGRFEHLADIISRTASSRRLAVCLDTCHVFAAGYELRTPDGYAETMAELDRHVGLRRVRCIHVNDAKTALGSRVDRHEHVGRGRLGLRAFRLLLSDPRLARCPRILETPKGKDDRERDFDALNLARLRRLARRSD